MVKKMKYVVFLGDGMADRPNDMLGGKTPLELAKKPNIDRLASMGECGMVKTIPTGMPKGSDTANLSVMGYDIRKCYTGRSPLEAVSMGIELKSTDVTMRCNLVSLSEDEAYEDKIMLDYSSDEISTREADILIKYLNEHLALENMKLYTGISYRHCLVWDKGHTGFPFTPPHDILTQRIGEHLISSGEGVMFTSLMKASYELLKDHPVNVRRRERGLKPANSIWLWGEGTRPELESFHDLYGVTGTVVSAVDLIKGIGKCAGLNVAEVAGVTGNIDTNFEGKAEAALSALLSGQDFAYIHVEAPDECGHRQEYENKIHSIELIDEKIVGPVIKGLEAAGEDVRALVLPDHPTPLALRTHTDDPVPYVFYDSTSKKTGVSCYTEAECEKTGRYIDEGCTLMKKFLSK